jgi:Arc/MetJ family transcription regulator
MSEKRKTYHILLRDVLRRNLEDDVLLVFRNGLPGDVLDELREPVITPLARIL